MSGAEFDDGAALIARSGLFDAAWYIARNPDLGATGLDPVRHFLHQGWLEGQWPNPYFDVGYYLAENTDIGSAGINPLLHYLLAGEAAHRPPCPHFDVAWYAERHAVASPLAHFLHHRLSGTVSPCADFDAAHYLRLYPDIAAAGVDPFDHYLHDGFREGRNPNPSFDSRFYANRYLGGAMSENPLVHWRQWRHALVLHTQPPAHEASVFAQARANLRPGPDFEDVQPLPRSAPRRAKLLAYYLPQFHRLEENDAWWGNGFTEWTAIARGMPRFPGHYQPRAPRDLGHYDLSDPETLRRQITLARNAGVFGFVHYFYWFNQRRLLERPMEALLADPSIDFPFCLMWANENWTRRWDGSNTDVLISQDYRAEDDAALVACFARHFADPRYVRIDGRPVLMVYRASLIPNCPETVARWRAMWREAHGCNPILVMAQSFDDRDPIALGFDGAIEFPPHKLTQHLPLRNRELGITDPAMTGQIYAYDDVVAASLGEPAPSYPLIRTVLPGWDNDARREGAGMALVGATPSRYGQWVDALVDATAAHPFLGERIVCVNAWNEWAEGAYLEPDVHYGAAFLNATGRAVAGLSTAAQGERLLLVGHDAYPADAQMLLLHLGRQLMAVHGVGVEFLLRADGALLPQYAALAGTHVAPDDASLAARIAAARARGIRHALVNTSAAASVIPLLAQAGIEAVLLVHELPHLISAQGLAPGASAALARRVIFPAASVRDAFPGAGQLGPGRARVLPQGLYRRIRFDPHQREALRRSLGIGPGERLVLAAGTGDMRKGFDLFLQAARIAERQRASRGRTLHFCWAGAIDARLQADLAAEIATAQDSGHVHLLGFRDDIAALLSAADVFALPSREDPFPSVALEAMAAGLAVAAFAGSGGIADLLPEAGGRVVPMSDALALVSALRALVASQDLPTRPSRAQAAAERWSFAAYTAEILAELRDAGPRISVAVPSHNYARYLPERLGSIFAQTHPVEEVMVLDDASTDDSVAVSRTTARDWRREIRLDVAATPGGSVFAQWARAAALARGSHLWIAEADDAADPELLARLAALISANPGLDLVFSDSRAVDANGAPLMADYKAYYRSAGLTLLERDFVMPGRAFLDQGLAVRNTILNASAVVFRTQALRDALARCGPALGRFSVAGDWLLYADILAHGDPSHGGIGYLAAPLNVHRRHAASATARQGQAATLAEIAGVHNAINALLPEDPARRRRQEAYRLSVAA